MKDANVRGRFARILVPGSSILLLGGCGLTDQQVTGIISSVITSGLSTLVNTIIAGLGSGATA